MPRKDYSHINPADLVARGGTSRSYVDRQTGEVISYRQGQKILGKQWAVPKGPKPPPSPVPPPSTPSLPGPLPPLPPVTASRKNYWRVVRVYAKQHGISAKEASQKPEVKKAIKTLRAQRKQIAKGKPTDLSPTGAYAQALVDLGVRDPTNPYRVGETPRAKSPRTPAPTIPQAPKPKPGKKQPVQRSLF